MPFPREVADEALVRCARRCCICRKFCGTRMQTHHIIQEADAGADTLDNCIPLCFDCHGEVVSYNPKHPIGRKFLSDELKRHRDIWFDFVKAHPERINAASDSFFVRSGTSLSSFIQAAAGPELSAAAVELLIEAVKEPKGQIWSFKLFRGARIFTNNRDFIEKDNPRSRALWEAALNELTRAGLVKYGEQFLPITDAGYKVADRLMSKR